MVRDLGGTKPLVYERGYNGKYSQSIRKITAEKRPWTFSKNEIFFFDLGVRSFCDITGKGAISSMQHILQTLAQCSVNGACSMEGKSDYYMSL